jgi:DNA-directed RNA polymerase subunit RPC12/RpoP
MNEYRAYGETICSNCGRVLKAIQSDNSIPYVEGSSMDFFSVMSDSTIEVKGKCKECNTENKIILKQF